LKFFRKHPEIKSLINSLELGVSGWLMPVILATQEVEIRRMALGSQPEELVQETLS
jgi:hypothetical protein